MPQRLVEGKYSVESLFEAAQNVVERKTTGSKILDVEAERRIPKFQTSELTLGRVLGRGGFCVVNEITQIKLKERKKEEEEESSHTGGEKLHDEHAIHNIIQDRSFMQAYCIRGKGRDCRYALKKLQATCKEKAQSYINGVVDLAIEARFLSVIRHPNIIKMRAMAITSPYSIEEPFFVVLDRLYDILGVRLQKWKKQRPGGVLAKLCDRKGTREMSFLIERLNVGYDLSCALSYLHDMNVVYRDIKPDNIGFDVRGDVKIFDFGLAKEIDPSQVDDSGNYKMTGDTGSPRYMAPEVALERPYNETVDVYSFSILLWQMLALETPFEGYTMNMFNNKVIRGGTRPKCDEKWPKEVSDMMRAGWGEPFGRPSMSEVSATLRDEIARHTDEDYANGSEMLDASRKSELSLRGRGGSSRGGSNSRSGSGRRKSVLSARALMEKNKS